MFGVSGALNAVLAAVAESAQHATPGSPAAAATEATSIARRLLALKREQLCDLCALPWARATGVIRPHVSLFTPSSTLVVTNESFTTTTQPGICYRPSATPAHVRFAGINHRLIKGHSQQGWAWQQARSSQLVSNAHADVTARVEDKDGDARACAKVAALQLQVAASALSLGEGGDAANANPNPSRGQPFAKGTPAACCADDADARVRAAAAAAAPAFPAVAARGASKAGVLMDITLCLKQASEAKALIWVAPYAYSVFAHIFGSRGAARPTQALPPVCVFFAVTMFQQRTTWLGC